MSSMALTAGEVMDRAAALLNDPQKTDYTYVAQIAYLNMAIDELVESLEESNAPVTNKTSAIFPILVGENQLVAPFDLIEIQEIGERLKGTTDTFVPLGRREFLDRFPKNNSLLFWVWENQIIKFNPNGALTPREIQLKYVCQVVIPATDEKSIIGIVNARSFLSYKTASNCAMYIGENETRALALATEAERALDRMTGISNKGKQEIVTRHRPFRASYKARGGF